MPSYGPDSREARDSCHSFIIGVLDEVIQYVDISVICGHRNETTQAEYFRTKRSKVQFPNSRHNVEPSMAFDFAPYPIDWGDTGTPSEREKARARFYFCAGVIEGVTGHHNLVRSASAGAFIFEPRFGLDWDGDMIFTDQTFDDLGHVEFRMVPVGVIRNG
jgi:peptidoglycan L-alanyl-D-glutamate endopeptidase CwlK